jgi:hypothetical protein
MGIYDELNDITGTKKNAPHKNTLTNSHREHDYGKTSGRGNKYNFSYIIQSIKKLLSRTQKPLLI